MTTDDNNDPLGKLFVDGQAIDRELLANAIFPYVRIYLEQGNAQIAFTKEGEALTSKEKLLTYLLARKAIHLRNKELLASEAVSPKELEAATGIPGGTIRPVLKQLRDERLVQIDKSEEGGYIARNHALNQISEMLSKKGK